MNLSFIYVVTTNYVLKTKLEYVRVLIQSRTRGDRISKYASIFGPKIPCMPIPIVGIFFDQLNKK